MKQQIAAVKSEKESRLKEELENIKQKAGTKMSRILELLQNKTAGKWLSTMPMQSLGYDLNKQDFRDGIRARYDWDVPGTPNYCQCGQKNSMDHTLICKLGGYVGMRHNRIRDLEADLMREVCHDVKVEPELLPIENERTRRGNVADKARLDVSGVGVWGSYERTFLDIRIMHPNSPSYLNKPVEQVFITHEQEKKRSYNERVLQVERGSFTPIVLSTYGGCGIEAERHHKRIARLIADKKNEEYADVINHIRTKLSVCLVKSIVTAIRGVRGKKNRLAAPLSSLEYNLIERFDDK